MAGGVIILCRDNLKFVQRRDLCCWKESTWIELKSFFSRSLLVGCYYRPPKQSTADVEEFIGARSRLLTFGLPMSRLLAISTLLVHLGLI